MEKQASRDLLLTVTQLNHSIFIATTERVSTTLARLQLTYQTAQALWAIDPEGAPASMSSVAIVLRCNASNVTFIAKQLEARGYVSRERDPADGRSHLLVLTDKGKDAREKFAESVISVTPFADCNDSELRTLAQLLTRVNSKL